MRTKLLLLKIAAIALLFFAPVILSQAQITIGEIKKSLICLCDCNMTVEACEGAMACEAAEKLNAEAQQLIDKGMDKPQILASFISRYGEHILAAPTKKGFNLTAWILPFAVIIVAGVGIVTILRRWVRLSQAQNGNAKANIAPSNDPLYEKKLDDVLQALD
ncbi:cytochrome c-type biogenesis protein CcmH [bacterium]|nr:cytochrome c-type biogenesis protein CcmH [bacterium]